MKLFIFLTLVVYVFGDDVLRFTAETYEGERYGKVCPNRRTKCKYTQTCCPTKHGSYHCCRYRNAVCCPDKYHCCPSGSTCDSRRKRCSRNLNDHPFLQVLADSSDSHEWKLTNDNYDKVVMCRDKRICGYGQSCCHNAVDGKSQCCPHENAICCGDGKHCCPSGSRCDNQLNKCVTDNVVEMSKLIIPSPNVKNDNGDSNLWPVLELQEIEDNLHLGKTCPNNKTHCKDTKTCCITKHGNYYCCPHKNAVCCPDKYHCCPQGNTCDSKTNKCRSSNSVIEMHRFSENVDVNLEKYCLGSKLKCPGQKRCCNMLSGKFGCCDYNKGVCCPDLKTCCPHGTKCDVKNKSCVANPMLLEPIKFDVDKKQRRSLAIFLEKENLKEVCPNGDRCPNIETCCPLGNGSYGCCPYEKGTCCPDHKTCCPHSKRCANHGCV